jgi:cyclic pyranopterin phosphate synthase
VPYNRLVSDGDLTHLDAEGRARMVDVGGKPATERRARARATVSFSAETLARLRAGDLHKGDVRAVAELAGILAAKRTSELIPLCHPLALTHVEVEYELADDPPRAVLTATVRTVGPTGVEMEALTAVTVAALTVYDMIKSVERGARIREVRLLEKHGGRSGDVVLED